LLLDVSINNYRAKIATICDLRHQLAHHADEPYREIWINCAKGPALSALLNGAVGFLIYLRESGDAGFTSRNPDYAGESNAVLEYQLANGQRDEFPAHWAVPESAISEALEYFVVHRQPTPFLLWHDDSV